MTQLELGLFCVWPVHAVHAQLRTQQSLLDFPGVRGAEHRERRVAKEHDLTARSKQPRGFGDPLVGIAPDRSSVLRDRQIERPLGKPSLFRVRLNELEAEPVLRVHPPGGIELGRRDVDADDPPRAATLQPRRHVGGATAELDDVLSGDARKHVDLGLRRVPDAPGDLLLIPGVLGPAVRVCGVVLRPVVTVCLDVVGEVGAAHAGRATSASAATERSRRSGRRGALLRTSASRCPA